MERFGAPSIVASRSDVVRIAHGRPGSQGDPAADLCGQLGPDEDFTLLMLFCADEDDLARISSALSARYPGTRIVGCTTAGEIGADGYASGGVVAIGFPHRFFACELVVIDDLADFDGRDLAARVMTAQSALRIARPDWTSDFACLLVDGLSLKEDRLAAALAAALGPVPFFGGSAGDGLRFQSTKVLADGGLRGDAAVTVLFKSPCPFHIFKIDHHAPTDAKMVVTAADPERRIVSEINAEPAAAEYARILGKDPGQLSPFFFAAHPLLVQIGGQKHVRSIQRVLDNGDLVFFSAIDEGVVLTVAEAGDIAGHLDDSLSALARDKGPEAIIGFDCILRRLEAEQNQAATAVSRCFAKHGVVGFNTYGEQINGAHVNQTLTGIAVYAPDGL